MIFRNTADNNVYKVTQKDIILVIHCQGQTESSCQNECSISDLMLLMTNAGCSLMIDKMNIIINKLKPRRNVICCKELLYCP